MATIRPKMDKAEKLSEKRKNIFYSCMFTFWNQLRFVREKHVNFILIISIFYFLAWARKNLLLLSNSCLGRQIFNFALCLVFSFT